MRLWKAHFTDAAGSKAVRKWQLLSWVLGTQGDPSRSLLGAEEVWLQVLRDALGDHLLQLRAPKRVLRRAGEEPLHLQVSSPLPRPRGHYT